MTHQAVSCVGVAIILAASAIPVDGQTTNSGWLEGVDSVDARISLTWDEHIDGYDKSTLESRLQTVLELELRTNHIRVSRAAPNVLVMEFVTMDDGDGRISLSYGIELLEPGLPLRVVNQLLAESMADGAKAERAATASGPDSVATRLAATWGTFLGRWLSTTGDLLPTWHGSSGVGHVGRNNLQASLEQQVRESVQEFVNAYLAAHPSGTG